jgi:glycosyltransferase involved in cell wall biosynthesis
MGRLVFFCPDVLGGVGSYLKNLSVFLTRAGIDHAIFSYGPGHSMRSTSFPGDSPYWTRIRFSRYASQGSVYKSFTGHIRQGDILICSDSLELEAINYGAPVNRIIFILHGDLEHYRAILKNNESILDHVFCVSRGLKDKYSGLFPRLEFSVCHPLIANYPIEGPRQRSIDRRQPGQGIFSRIPLLGLFIGRFEYMKGADTFIEVVNEGVKEKIPVQWKVFATSTGADKELISEIPASVQITYDLPNDKLMAWIEKSDLLLFPSRSEGFGIVVLEAMKRGVVPVARDLPIGIPDMIIDKQTGYLARDASEMLAIIRELDADRDQLETTGRMAARFANEEFDFDRMGRRFMDNIAKVTGGSVRSGKPFLPWRQRAIEKYLPEPVYRLMKRLYKNRSAATK